MQRPDLQTCIRKWKLFAFISLATSLSTSCARNGDVQSRPRHQATPAAAATSQSSESKISTTSRRKGGAFATGKYRNLFAERGKSAAEIDAKVQHAYQQLFHGNPENEAILFAAGTNANGRQAYIMDIGNGDIRSEGMSYGMMLAVEYNRKGDFDAIWNWAKSHMFHASSDHPVFGYFSWQMRTDGTAIDEMPAPDGEEYFATALLFASNRWGDGDGIYDYKSEALELLDSMKNRQPITGYVNDQRTTTGVALFNAEQKMVRFTPDMGNFERNGDFTDPSYQVPAFYELWALWGPESDRAFWVMAAWASRDYFVKVTHPLTGLSPDYANYDGTPKAVSWDQGTVNFRYDAFRTAMNWSVDAAWWAKDPRETELSNRVIAFFSNPGAKNHSNFTLDGKPTNDNETLGLVAANAVAALSATDPRAGQFVDELFRREPPTGKWRYYDGMLYTMALLHLSGRFRICVSAGAPFDFSGY
jgi:oligosaccharide reducing-end xylanase